MKFAMSDDEIRVSFNTAKNQKGQVKVLADLNAVSRREMEAKLRELGCNVPQQPVKQKVLRTKNLFDEDRARQLFAEGRSDLECAEMLGVSTYAFSSWRRKNGMRRPTGGAIQNKAKVAKSAPCKAQPPMPPEIETPEQEPVPETAGHGSQPTLSAPQKPTSAAALGRVLLDLAERYHGLVLTVNGAAVQSLCLNVRVPMNGEDAMSLTLDLEVV